MRIIVKIVLTLVALLIIGALANIIGPGGSVHGMIPIYLKNIIVLGIIGAVIAVWKYK